jgi:hypothetical protein
MATVAITAANLLFDTASANLGVFGAATNTAGAAAATGGGEVPTTVGDGWLISPATGRNLADGTLLLILSTDATGDTFTIVAGNRPPSMRPGLAATTYVVAANNTIVVAPDVAAHLLTAGTIQVTCTDIGSSLAAVSLPRGA